MSTGEGKPQMREEAQKVLADLSVRFRPALMAFFLRRIRNYPEAEDLTQEVLLRVAQKSEMLDASRPDAYVFRIAANLLRDRHRRNQIRDAYLAGGLIDGTLLDERDPDRVLSGKQSLATVAEALRQMPERTRTIFILFRLENLKQREIADMLGVSVRTIEQHVVRASLFLRESFGEDR